MQKMLWTLGVFAVMAGIVFAVRYWRHETMVQFPIPGLPGENVDFVLCDPMIGERGWIIRAGGSESKHAFVSRDVSAGEIRRNARISYSAGTVIIIGPRGEEISLSGFGP